MTKDNKKKKPKKGAQMPTPAKQPFHKKGQLAGSIGAVILLVVGVGVAVLVLIFVGALGGQTYNLVEPDINDLYGTVTNETFTATNGTAAQLSHKAIESGTLTVYNATNSQIGLGNFSVNYPQGTITLTSNLQTGTQMNATYTFGDANVETSVKNSIISGFSALEQTGNYLPIIVLAVVIALVLGLVLSFTSFGGMGGGNGSAL